MKVQTRNIYGFHWIVRTLVVRGQEEETVKRKIQRKLKLKVLKTVKRVKEKKRREWKCRTKQVI